MIILVVVLFILTCFGGAVLFGAPYLPTLKPQVGVALKLTGLKPGQKLLELGSGDGRVLIAAAQQGMIVIGYEVNPILVAVSKIRTWRYRKQVTIVWGDLWRKDWPPADAIFVFLLPKFMGRLDKKIEQYDHKPVKLVSFAFSIKGRKPSANKDGVFAYDYR